MMKNSNKHPIVAFFFGGVSPEHEVSVITAVQAMAATPATVKVLPVYVAKNGRLYTGDALKEIKTYQNLASIPDLTTEVSLPTNPDGKAQLVSVVHKLLSKTTFPFDVIFPCFHGGVGEGGWIQGVAEYLDVPLAGSGLTGSVIGMDKVLMKHALSAALIKQAPYSWFYRSEWSKNKNSILKKLLQSHPFPVYVKPSRGGSSIGTTKADNKTELVRAIDLAASLDTRVLVESGIENAREINCSVMGYAGGEIITSVLEEVGQQGSSNFLDFSQKYLQGEGKSRGMASTSRIIPADLDKVTSSNIQALSKEIFRLFDCAGVSRIDFLLKGKSIYCVEINTIPGSLSFYLWEKSGYPYAKLIKYLIDSAVKVNRESAVITSFSSNILSHFETTSGSKTGKLKTRN